MDELVRHVGREWEVIVEVGPCEAGIQQEDGYG